MSHASNVSLCPKLTEAPAQDLTRVCAARLCPLAAESERMFNTGMTQEAYRFLMEVRSLQYSDLLDMLMFGYIASN